ncbi:MAG: type II toxin-antitoxin system prevent-host-death family antitoxin [bacterium]|nr:type II toxin-antitoxin system prevent-host-death family antitoxin [bacterium]
MNAVLTSRASKNLDNLIEEIIADAEPSILLTGKGKKAVLMSFDEFSSWQETLYLLSNPVNAEHLHKSIEEAKEGKTFEKELTEL